MDAKLPQPVKPPIHVRVTRYLRGLVVRLMIYFLIYFVVAFVSIGPCFWSWYESTYVGGSIWVAKFYAPFSWICDNCPPLSRLVNKYVEWWVA